MTTWKDYFWKNTVSNYVRTFARLGFGIVLFRLLYSGLDSVQFGFWALLWSLFGYGVLLDFGLGFTAQKNVAQKVAEGDTDGLSRLLSTMVWTFVGLALVLWIIFLALRPIFLSAIEIPPERTAEFTRAYLFFFGGLGLIFPIGLFPEMLRGLQRLYLANWMTTLGHVFNFGGILLALTLDWGFPIIVLISVSSILIPDICASFIAMKLLRGVSLHPRWFDFRAIKSQLGFSLVAYIITFSNLIMIKADQLVISLVIGVSAVTLYQAGFRIATLLGTFTAQLQDALSPAAAQLHAQGDLRGMQELLTRSSRLTFLLTTPLYALCVVYLDPLIRVLTGLETVSAQSYWVGQAMLATVFSSQLTNSCSKRIMMMSGHEKTLLGVSLGDGVSNILLSVILAHTMGIIGVAVGSLIPTVLFGWLLMLPLTLRYVQLSFGAYLRFHLQGTVLPLGVFFALLTGVLWLAPIAPDSGIVALLWRGALPTIPLALLSWKLVRAVHH